MKSCKQFEEVIEAIATNYHNTVCDKKCYNACHERCGVEFATTREPLLGCLINDGNGKCKKCGCPVLEHTHVMVGYEKKQVETA